MSNNEEQEPEDQIPPDQNHSDNMIHSKINKIQQLEFLLSI